MSAPDAPDVCVIGAGVAGLATAMQLRCTGRRVLVIDPAPPASETSSGNAGLLSPDTAIPIAMPGLLRRIPGHAPVVDDIAYVPDRFTRSSRIDSPSSALNGPVAKEIP